MKKKANSSIPLCNIHINDDFWKKYVKLVKEVIIPYQWDVLNDRVEGVAVSHCIENFRIAAGEKKGEHQGAVFQDTDVAKWLEAVGFALSAERDEELEALADETIELIGRAQKPDGYINTYYTIKEPEMRWTNLTEGHELYTAGHMIEAAVAYYEATGKTKMLEIVCRFADLICRTFGPDEGQIHGYPGHQEIELALVKLYRITGEKSYLATAQYFIDARGEGENYFLKEEQNKAFRRIFPEFVGYDTKYSQSHIPVRKQKRAEGHAVRAVYMYSAMADLAYECRDESLLEACRTLWEDIVHKQMYITGSIGSSGLLERFTTDYDLPNDCNYSETCASIGLAMFGKRMADITKDASYMDTVERALYNTVLSGIAMDGKSFFYVNPLEVWPDNCIPRTFREHVKPVRQKWFGVACCPPNIARTLASLGQYIYFREEEQIYINLYIANNAEILIGGVPFRLKLSGNFPWENQIRFEITGERETEVLFAFRIPSYAKNFRISRGGEQADMEIVNSYAVLKGVFKDDVIDISFDAPPVFVRANPRVRADIGKAAIVKGPLVYCMEEVDNGGNLSAVFADTERDFEVLWDEKLFGGSQVIRFSGKKLVQQEWGENMLYSDKAPMFAEIKMRAVPYCYWGNRKTGEMIVWIKECL